MDYIRDKLNDAIKLIKNSLHTVAFTGAGISVESGIPPFRGKNGLWSKYDPIFLDINYFHQYPEKSWRLIKEILYDFFGNAKPNAAHYTLAEMESNNLLQSIITQNIDNLHQIAGSKKVFEFHGNSRTLICETCSKTFVLHGFPHEARITIIKNAYKSLKKNGKFFILDYNEFELNEMPFFIKFPFKLIECPYAYDFIKRDLEKILINEKFNSFIKHLYFGGFIRLLKGEKAS